MDIAALFPYPASLTCMKDVRLPAGLDVVVLAPHPDDFDAIGVTLRHLHRHGAVIHLAVLTDGASGVEDGFMDASDNSAKASLREAEQKASCEFFGLPAAQLSFLRLPADAKGNPRMDEANHTTIRDYLLSRQPQLVFMPHGNDSNVTHQRTYTLFRTVALAEKLQLWAVLNQDAKTIAMHRDLYTPFDDEDASWKAQLLRLHLSQHQRNLNTRGHGFDERVLAVNQQSASELNITARYAEVFELEPYR